MLLQCGTTELAGAGARGVAWLQPGVLASVAELNELSLALLAEQAAAQGAVAGLLLRQVHELWQDLDAAGRRRAAACPYLLLDAGFSDLTRWQPASPVRVRDDGGDYAAFFTVPAATGLARLIFTLGWHLACSQGEAARVLLGMSAATAAVMAGYTLCQIDALAVCRAGWLRPRWPTRVRVWRELLAAAAQGETPALERARLRGLTLLAAEMSLAPRHGGAGMPARTGRAA